MAKKKPCQAGHAGCNCTMSSCCGVTPDRLARIRQDARSGTNWAQREADSSNSPSGSYSGTCTCGAGLRTLEAANALKGVHGQPSGLCARHPGGTVFRDSDRK